ncbi:MAG: glycosyltransferase [Alphaproteobacteria bacterium]
MMNMFFLMALASALAWLVLLFARGGFWRPGPWLEDGETAEALDAWPEVAAILPARDEAAVIGQAMAGHATSAYPGRLSLIVVDDASNDGTGALAREAFDAALPDAATDRRSLLVMDAPPLEAGWTGKLAAQQAGLKASHDLAPGARYVLLTDADIVLGPDVLSRLVAKAVRERRALVSVMARLDSRGFWGSLLIPAFIFFFRKLYPFRRVNAPEDPVAGAAGGCMLVDRFVLERAGGFAAIRRALIDDCTLARLIKGDPPARSIWLGHDPQVVSLRDNRSFSSIWSMVTRTAFAQLHYSVSLLVGTLIGMTVIYLAGPLAVLGWQWHGSWLALGAGAVAWGLMAFAYRPTVLLYGQPALAALALPLAAALYTLMTLSSALSHFEGRGGAWKGRTYPGRH